MQLLFFRRVMVRKPSLARGSRCSRRVRRALAKCLKRWERSCGQSTREVPEALRAQSQFVLQKCFVCGSTDSCGERVACTACASCVQLPLSLSGREFVVCTIMHGSCMAQVNKRLEICLGVSCKSALFVLSLHSYTVSHVVRTSSWLVCSDPTVSQSRKGIIIFDPQS